MTTHDRDKVIAAAKESGIKRAFVCAKPEECPDDDDCCHNQKPDGYWVKDEQLEAFYAIAFDTGRKSVDTPVALAEAYHCGEKAGRAAEQERCARIIEAQDVVPIVQKQDGNCYPRKRRYEMTEQEKRTHFFAKTGRIATSELVEYQAFLWGMEYAEESLRQKLASRDAEVAELKKDAVDFHGQVNRLTEWNDNLVGHRDELITERDQLREQVTLLRKTMRIFAKLYFKEAIEALAATEQKEQGK